VRDVLNSLRYHCSARVFDGASRKFHRGVPTHAQRFEFFPATDQQLDWTSDKMKEFKVANLMGAHCTGIEAAYRIRERLALPRASAVVGSVGSSFVLGEGIHPGPLAK
jgi:hypothetical protein